MIYIRCSFIKSVWRMVEICIWLSSHQTCDAWIVVYRIDWKDKLHLVLIPELLKPEKAMLGVLVTQESGNGLYCFLKVTAHRGSGDPSQQEPCVPQRGRPKEGLRQTSRQRRMTL